MRFLLMGLLFCVAVGSASAQTGSTLDDETTSPADEDALLELANQSRKGDLEEILASGFIRVATANNPLFFNASGVDQGGLAVEISREMEKFLRKTYPKKARHINVILLPMGRDDILPALSEGRADVAAANLTITPERSEEVAFSIPTSTGVRELVISGPAAPAIAGFDDLAATTLHLRRSSSYFEHLSALNEAREAEGKPVIPIEEMDEHLEDYDILEMINADLLPATIVDSHKAAIWHQVFDKIKIHEDIAVNEGGEIAWAVRKDNPELLAAINTFVKSIRKGTLLGNILINRYIKNRDWVGNARADESMARFEQTLEIIKRYANEYNFDWLMIAAQGYQESKLDQSKRSKVGAIGIMQVMPNTAKDPVVGIPDVTDAENNIHAGVRYLRFLRETYFNDPEIAPLDRVLLSFGAYNAGPGNMKKARRRAEKLGLDPNVWFDNVEIAAAKAVSREPVIYVRNIYKYYIAYKFMQKTREAREAVTKEVAQ